MPCDGGGDPISLDPRRWQRCLDQVKAEMVAEGWLTYAKKFWEVQHRRARKLFMK